MDSRKDYEPSLPSSTFSAESSLVAQALIDLRAASCHDEPAPATEAQHVHQDENVLSPRGSLQNTKGTTSHRPSSDIPKKKETAYVVRRTTYVVRNKQSKKVNIGRWSKKEHDAFMEGMIAFHGDTRKWIQVSRMVRTRSADQCKTHSQKFLISLDKQRSSKGLKKQRALKG